LVEGTPGQFADGRNRDKNGEGGDEEGYEQIGWLKSSEVVG